jgi:hypothetical protein
LQALQKWTHRAKVADATQVEGRLPSDARHRILQRRDQETCGLVAFDLRDRYGG